jgi:hypothetical protein
MRHPNTMGGAEVEQFLTDLAVNGHVAASTQNQALIAVGALGRQTGRGTLPRESCKGQDRPMAEKERGMVEYCDVIVRSPRNRHGIDRP